MIIKNRCGFTQNVHKWASNRLIKHTLLILKTFHFHDLELSSLHKLLFLRLPRVVTSFNPTFRGLILNWYIFCQVFNYSQPGNYVYVLFCDLYWDILLKWEFHTAYVPPKSASEPQRQTVLNPNTVPQYSRFCCFKRKGDSCKVESKYFALIVYDFSY